MAYIGRDWDNTGTKVTKEDFKRIETGIKNNDTAITEQATKIEDNTNEINVLNNDRGYLATKSVTDANLATENGFYLLDIDGLNSPDNTCSLTLQTIKQSGFSNRTQIAIVYYPVSVPFIYVRKSVNNVWGSWSQIVTSDRGYIKAKNLDVVDLNTVVETGYYCVREGSTNMPYNNWGILEVVQGSVAGNHVVQTYTLKNSQRRYYRIQNGTTWTAWEQISTVTQMQAMIDANNA